jgi:plastocyanin domain-containing protein
MNKTALSIITLSLILAAGIVLSGTTKGDLGLVGDESVHNVEIREGVQYVTIEARGGYAPRVSTAKAGIPTKLIVKTNGTYDCSSSLVIRSIGYQKILPQTGEEVIDLGTPVQGVSLQGMCSMGMYSFLINFS